MSGLLNNSRDSSLSSDDENYNNKVWINLESKEESDKESDQLEEEEVLIYNKEFFKLLLLKNRTMIMMMKEAHLGWKRNRDIYPLLS